MLRPFITVNSDTGEWYSWCHVCQTDDEGYMVPEQVSAVVEYTLGELIAHFVEDHNLTPTDIPLGGSIVLVDFAQVWDFYPHGPL